LTAVENFNRCEICIIEIPDGEKRMDGAKEPFETLMVKNFQQLVTGIKPQVLRFRIYREHQAG
jgi:hypothetical protein